MIIKFKKPIALLLAVTMAMLLNFPSGIFAGIGIGLTANAENNTQTSTITFTALDGTAGDNTAENYYKLIDGQTSTKWCVTSFSNYSSGVYIVFKASERIFVDGYTITTGNDNSSYIGRNPKKWTLKGCNDYNKENKTETWVNINTVTNDDVLKDTNNTAYDFSCPKTTTAYQYFKLEITANNGGNCMQMSEFTLSYDTCDHVLGTEKTGTIDPTCTEGGYDVYECTKCGSEVKVTNDIPVTEHNKGEDGKCTNCGAYIISNADELKAFAATVNGGETSANAVLTENITVNSNLLDLLECDTDGKVTNGNSFTAWTPIGYYNSDSGSRSYTGTFDGQGHTISGLYFNDTQTSYVGLFGYVGENGRVLNVGVVDSYFNGKWHVGGVCGDNEGGTIQNCYNTGAVSAAGYVGGVCGRNYNGTIENCYSTGAVSGTGCYVGGVCGDNRGTIKNCYSTGAVSGLDLYVGGVCGDNYGPIENCYSTGAVSAAGDYVGGVCGRNYDGTIKNCYYDTDFYTGNAIGSDSGTANNVTGKSTADLCGSLDDLGFDSTVWTAGSYSADGKKATATFPQLKVFENTSAPTPTVSLYNFGTNGSDDWKPYTEISTADELQSINLSGNYVLTDDITLTAPAEGGSNWTAIGTESTPFAGKFDGDGHTVSGIVIISTYDYQGLFGYSKGTIMNVGVLESSIDGSNNVGGVCGKNNGTIENCYSTGAVSGTMTVGGVCGWNEDGTIKNCYSTGAVSGLDLYVGGVCGYNYGIITNCYSTGAVSGTSAVGGVCGWNFGTIKNCYYDTDFYTGNAIGNNQGTETDVTGKTTDELCGSTLPAGFETSVWTAGSYSEDGKKATATLPQLKVFENTSAPTPTVLLYNFGTEENPYQIKTAEELALMASKVNSGEANYSSAHYKLTADIVLNESLEGTPNEWTAIGTESTPFTGTFDGDGHTISGIVINSTAVHQGLFGYSTGTIMNVGVINSDITGANYVGGVCGYNYGGTIENCYSTGAVSGIGAVGGICGNNNGTITNCYNTGVVSGTDIVGGVCGNNNDTITNCYNTGAVSGREYLGGVCGRNYDTIKNCYYLTGTATGGIYGTDDVANNVLVKTTTQFTFGEVAYLLSQGGGNAGSVWGQKIGTDDYPVLNGAKVYATTGCVTYNNKGDTSEKEHKYEEGICTNCGGYEDPEKDESGVYQISKAADLYWFAEYVNSGNNSVNAVLTNDITVNENVLKDDGNLADIASGFTSWTPIGSSTNKYIGTFDGQGHTISGLYFNNTQTNYVGLFGYVGDGGHVLNVGVVDSYFSGGSNVGGVCGDNSGGTIENCYNTGTVSGSSSVGGVCGYNKGSGKITNCYNKGKVSGSNYVGGVCGYNGGTITNCYYLKTDTINKDIYAIGNENSDTAGKAESQTTYFTDGTICDLVEYHSHQNGICILCGNYKTATLTTDKYDINGDNTKDEVYEISSAGQLYWFEALVNGGTTNANAVLTADITVNKDVLKSDGTLTDAVSGFKSWTPIGYYSGSGSKSYTGTFDGQGHTISGLYFNDTKTDYVGLFGYVGEKGRVLNVGVVDSYFSSSNLVGGVCGYNYKGTIKNCYNEGTVSGSSGSNNSNYVGGVCGDNDNGTIENCYNKGTVSGSTTAGGVCGYNKGSGKITNCYNKGKVSGGAASKVGGVCGWNYGTIENCYSAGAVSGDNKYVGGVCGYNGGTIENCYNTGTVSGVESVGGVCGYNKGKITNCYNEDTVSGSSNYVGGVCGYNEGGTITNCYNTVSISKSSYYVGGVCGYNENGTITGCYYDSDKCKVGGIKSVDTVGQAEGKTSQQFASGEVAYLLQRAQTVDAETDKTPMVWGQTIGTDDYPVFYKNNTVYYGYANCNAADKTYTNIQNDEYGHSYTGENHACAYCGNAFAAIAVDYAKLANALTNIYNVDSNGNIGDKANVTVDTDTGVVTCLIKVNGDKALIDTYTLNISAGDGETKPITIEKTKYKKTSGENSINIDMVQLVNELEVGSYTATLTLYDAEGHSICIINEDFAASSGTSLAE